MKKRETPKEEGNRYSIGKEQSQVIHVEAT